MGVAYSGETKTCTGEVDNRTPADLEWLVEWAIQRQLADKIVEWRDTPETHREGTGWTTDGTVQAGEIGRLGAKIPGGGGGYATQSLHPDAELVYQAIRDLGRNERNLVLDFARRGRRPEHSPCHVVEWVPEPTGNHPTGWRYNCDSGHWEAITRKVRRKPGVRYCPIKLADRGRELENARWLYLSWHRGMRGVERLVMARLDEFRDYRPLPLAAPREPWQQDMGAGG